MNKVIIIGNVTKNVDRQVTAQGTVYARFTVAVNRRGKDEGTDFFNVVAWEKLADTCAAFLSKGRKVCVEGSLRFGEYTDRDGVKRHTVDITAQSVEFLSPADKCKEDTLTPVETDKGDLPF